MLLHATSIGLLAGGGGSTSESEAELHQQLLEVRCCGVQTAVAAAPAGGGGESVCVCTREDEAML